MIADLLIAFLMIPFVLGVLALIAGVTVTVAAIWDLPDTPAS